MQYQPVLGKLVIGRLYLPGICLAILILLLSGCTAVLDQGRSDALNKTTKQKVTKTTALTRPKLELTQDLLYKLLVAEFAGQRKQFPIAVKNYLDVARTTRDPAIVARATRIAVYARDKAAAKEAANLWFTIDPNSTEAHQILAVIAVREGDTDQALTHLDAILKAANPKNDLSHLFWMVANILGREQDREEVLLILEKLMLTRQDNPDALFAYAQVLTRMNKLTKARKALEQALALVPENHDFAIIYVSLLSRLGKDDEALTWLKDALQKIEQDFELRHFYARLLTDLQRFDEARRQFEILAKRKPVPPDILFSLGLLYLHAEDTEAAKICFADLTVLNDYTDDANYYLGRIAEDKNDLEQAKGRYENVVAGKNHFDAQVRLGILLSKQGEIEAARAQLGDIYTNDQREEIILIQAEGEILTNAKRYEEAMQIYNHALEDKFDDDLLYARAMLAEKMNRLDILEQDLRAILAKDPHNSQALNALGYTLADRTERYDEAYQLIRRALEINPDDHYILDSMGWVLYRRGCLSEAVKFLRKSLSKHNDPEVAAHLGEVLWVKGDRQAAQEIWDTALQKTPDDVHLHKVINRLVP